MASATQTTAAASVQVISHPLVHAKVSRICDPSVSCTEVRQTVDELTRVLAVEATRDLDLSRPVSIVCILRSGLSMIQGFHEVLGQSCGQGGLAIHHLGLFREKTTLDAVEYYNKIPDRIPRDSQVIIVDPLVATGATAAAAISTVKGLRVSSVKFVSIIGAEKGLQRASAVWPGHVNSIVGTIQEVDEKGYFMSGVGNIGGRLYGSA